MNFNNIKKQEYFNTKFNEASISDRLENWPDHITLKECKEQIELNQIIVVEQTRSLFCKIIINAVNNSVPNIVLNFPNNLLNNNKKIIIGELIDRFGVLSITGQIDDNTLCETNCINDIEDIPPNPVKIHLEFLKEN